MATIRVCLCPCGHFGIQEAEAAPSCHACGSEDVDWINVDSDDLKKDLGEALELLPDISGEEDDGIKTEP